MLFSMQCLFAQPVLNNNLNFALGDKYRIDGYNDVTIIDPGGPGGNQVWDFEVINGQDFFEGVTAICVDPAITPFVDSTGAAGANIAIKPFESDHGSYQYYTSGSDARELLAMGWYQAGNTSFSNYLNSYTDLQFPLAFGDDFEFDTEMLMYSVDMSYYVMRDSGHVSVEADAWGAITTPVATHPNVLRLKTTSVIHSWYRYDIGEPWNYLGEFTDISYNWYASDIKVPVLTIMEFLFDKENKGMYSVHYLAEYEFPTGIESLENEDFRMYPNPAKTFVNVVNGDGCPVEDIIIYNLQGQEMLRQNARNGRMDVSDLKPGCYFMELRAKKNIMTRKLLIQ